MDNGNHYDLSRNIDQSRHGFNLGILFASIAFMLTAIIWPFTGLSMHETYLVSTAIATAKTTPTTANVDLIYTAISQTNSVSLALNLAALFVGLVLSFLSVLALTVNSWHIGIKALIPIAMLSIYTTSAVQHLVVSIAMHLPMVNDIPAPALEKYKDAMLISDGQYSFGIIQSPFLLVGIVVMLFIRICFELRAERNLTQTV